MTAKQNKGVYAPDGALYITLTDGGGNLMTVETATDVTVGTTAITSGTTTRVLYDNAGTLGEYAISGTGSVAMTTSPAFTTPTLGIASGTSATLSGFAKLTGVAIGSLNGSPAAGMVQSVTDALVPVVGSTVVAGGAAKALVWYNGTDWTVIGV